MGVPDILERHLRENLQQIKEGTTELEPIEALGLVMEEAVGMEITSALELGQYDFDEALGLAFTALIENGIDDPETYLKEKGILE